jgi:hypothetical protein
MDSGVSGGPTATPTSPSCGSSQLSEMNRDGIALLGAFHVERASLDWTAASGARSFVWPSESSVCVKMTSPGCVRYGIVCAKV